MASEVDETVDIVVVASCNIDLISYVDRMPKIGETLNGNDFSMGFGGNYELLINLIRLL